MIRHCPSGARIRAALAALRRRRWLAIVTLVLVAALLIAIRAGVFRDADAAWLRVQETGVWRVGMDPSFPPFESLDAAGRPVGFDVDLAEAIAAHWGVRVAIGGIGFDQLIDAVAAQQVDSALSALPRFPERAKEVSFSSPYVEAGIVIAVPAGSDIGRADDLSGRKVAAEWGSAGDAEARGLRARLSGGLELVLRESGELALGAVLSGEADAAVVDAISLALFDPAGEQLMSVGPPLRPDPYVAIVPADAPDLLGHVNEALAALETDGVLPALRARWLSPKMLQ